MGQGVIKCTKLYPSPHLKPCCLIGQGFVKVLEKRWQVYKTSARVHLVKIDLLREHDAITCLVKAFFFLALLSRGIKSPIVRFPGWKPSGYSGPCIRFGLWSLSEFHAVWLGLVHICGSDNGSVSQGVVFDYLLQNYLAHLWNASISGYGISISDIKFESWCFQQVPHDPSEF